MPTKRRFTRKELDAARDLIKDLIEYVRVYDSFSHDEIERKIAKFEFDFPA